MNEGAGFATSRYDDIPVEELELLEMTAEDEIEAPAGEAASAPEETTEDVEETAEAESDEEPKGGRAQAPTSPTNSSSSRPQRSSSLPPTPCPWGAS